MLKQTSKTDSGPYFYRNRAVNDLAWALLSPSLFRHLPDAEASWFKDDYIDDEILHWLAGIDQAPEDLYEHLSQQRSTRIGIYFEQLLSFYFEQHPRFTLLAKNLQINKQKKTLGELDFVVLDHGDKQYKHIEAALKFYLGYIHADQLDYRGQIDGNTPLHNWHHWVGPNQKDSLAIKMRHLLTHQLPIVKTQAGRKTLDSLGIEADAIESRLHMKGRFYLPDSVLISGDHHAALNNHQPHPFKPHYCSHECLISAWYSSSALNLQQNTFTDDAIYYFLPRQYWLSNVVLSKDFAMHSIAFTAPAMLKKINDDSGAGIREWQLVEFKNDKSAIHEQRRFFVLNQRYLPSDK